MGQGKWGYCSAECPAIGEPPSTCKDTYCSSKCSNAKKCLKGGCMRFCQKHCSEGSYTNFVDTYCSSKCTNANKCGKGGCMKFCQKHCNDNFNSGYTCN